MEERTSLNTFTGQPLGMPAETRMGSRATRNLVLTAGVFAALLGVGAFLGAGSLVDSAFEQFDVDEGNVVADGSREWIQWMSGVLAGPVGIVTALAVFWIFIHSLSRWRFGKNGPGVAERFLD